jgi:hypothetical protein
LLIVMIGVTSVWATLGRGYVVIRSIVVLSIGLVSFASVFLIHFYGLMLCAILLTHVVVTLTSLYIVRLCGYRVVRIAYSSPASPAS